MSPSPVRPVVGKAALVAGGLVAGLLLGEAVTRLVMPGLRATGAGPALYRHDDLLGWEKRPGVEARARSREWDVVVRTNSHGLRGPEVSLAKPDGARRVLLLGDSFIEGYTVEQEETVSSALRRRLAGSATAVEVLNGGTAGYSTDQELLFFERDGVRFEPDVVVLFFYLNDLAYNARPSYWRGAKPYFQLDSEGLTRKGVPVPAGAWRSRELSDALTRGASLYALIRRAVTGGLHPTRANDAPATEPAAAAPPDQLLPFLRAPDEALTAQWALTEALLERLAERVEAAGARFLIFHVPAKPAVYDEVWASARDAYRLSDERWSPSADAEALGRICERIRTECILPLERFRAERDALGSPSALYFPVDGHWTAVGHALAARIVAERLAGGSGFSP